MGVVLIEFNSHCLICQKHGCYETMVSLYREMSIDLDCTELCNASPDEFSFIVETVGGRFHNRSKSAALSEDVPRIAAFYRIRERWNGNPRTAPAGCRAHQRSASWVFYNMLARRSVVCDSLEVASCYPEFAVIDSVPDTREARAFFHNKPWPDKESLTRKVLAFMVLFT